MAQDTNVFSSYEAVGNAEDIEDVIYDVSPEETIGLSMCSRVKATNRVHQFQNDVLDTPAANQQIEGNAYTLGAVTATTMLNNVTQISNKVYGVTNTQEAIEHHGRGSEIARLDVRKGVALKTDMDVSIFANTAKVTGDDSTARKTAGAVSWIKTNIDKASDGTNPTGDGSDTRTDGTQRIFTEDLLKNALQLSYTNGCKASKLVAGAFNKRQMSGFTGGAMRVDKGEDKKLYASIDFYEGDFHILDIVPSRQIRTRDVLGLDPDYMKIAVLRPMTAKDLAVQSDAKRRVVETEWAFVPCNQKAHFGVFDLTTS